MTTIWDENGYTISGFGHALVLGWGWFSPISAKQFKVSQTVPVMATSFQEKSQTSDAAHKDCKEATSLSPSTIRSAT